MAATSEYLLEPIRNRAEFTLYRGRRRGNPMPLLAVAPTTEPPPPQTLRRLEHEYSLAAELEPAWAAKPIALARPEGGTLTEALPFAAADLLQWIHCQIARHPLPPANSGRPVEGRSSVDPVLNRFVFKPEPWPPVFPVGTNTISGWRFLSSHSTVENADG